jgi:hypothetical protein
LLFGDWNMSRSGKAVLLSGKRCGHVGMLTRFGGDVAEIRRRCPGKRQRISTDKLAHESRSNSASCCRPEIDRTLGLTGSILNRRSHEVRRNAGQTENNCRFLALPQSAGPSRESRRTARYRRAPSAAENVRLGAGGEGEGDWGPTFSIHIALKSEVACAWFEASRPDLG